MESVFSIQAGEVVSLLGPQWCWQDDDLEINHATGQTEQWFSAFSW